MCVCVCVCVCIRIYVYVISTLCIHEYVHVHGCFTSCTKPFAFGMPPHADVLSKQLGKAKTVS